MVEPGIRPQSHEMFLTRPWISVLKQISERTSKQFSKEASTLSNLLSRSTPEGVTPTGESPGATIVLPPELRKALCERLIPHVKQAVSPRNGQPAEEIALFNSCDSLLSLLKQRE